jgi:YggT family protein
MTGFADILSRVIHVYQVIIMLSVLVSWVNPDPRNPIVGFLRGMTEPVFTWVRRRLPFVVIGPVDLSPLVVLLGLLLLNDVVIPWLVYPSSRTVVGSLRRTVAVTAGYVLGCVEAVLFIYLLAVLAHQVLSRVSSNPFNPAEDFVRAVVRPGLRVVHRVFPWAAARRQDVTGWLLILLLVALLLLCRAAR